MKKYRFTEPLEMPRGMKYGSVYTIFQSRKLGRIVTTYSELEYENVISLEMDPNVETYCEQPLRASFFIDGVERSTVFDTWVLYRSGEEELQEIKYYTSLFGDNPDPNAVRQNEVQTKWCELNNFKLAVRTEKDIHMGTEHIRNLKYLAIKALRYGKRAPKNAHIILGEQISGYNSVSIDQLIKDGVLSAQNSMDVVADLYYRGIITIPSIYSKVLDAKTEVRFNG